MARNPRIVIIGGGASGTLAAVQLLRSPARRREIVLLERSGTVGPGVAYATTCSSHLLNVPAGSMSGLPDDPDHFVRWLRGTNPTSNHSSFVPRRVYGQYLADLLLDAQAHSSPSTTFCRLHGEAVSIDEARRPTIRLANRRSIVADAVVLALGHQRPADLPGGPGLSGYIDDPWTPDRLAVIGRNDHVALAGTGLTAIDALLTLRDNGHRGKITAISRHGLLPHAHDVSRSCSAVAPPAPGAGEVVTARGMLHLVRSEVMAGSRRGQDWRAVVDALRPVSPALWQRMSLEEQQRFARHLARYWDLHRHRVAPDVATFVADLQRQVRFEVVQGRVERVENRTGRLLVVTNRTAKREVDVDWLINCTGPPGNIRNADHPLVRQMRTAGLLSPHPSGFGVVATADGAVLRWNGRRIRWLWALGPLLKGALWESTAIPEIRDQAARLAEVVLNPQMDRPPGKMRAAPGVVRSPQERPSHSKSRLYERAT